MPWERESDYIESPKSQSNWGRHRRTRRKRKGRDPLRSRPVFVLACSPYGLRRRSRLDSPSTALTLRPRWRGFTQPSFDGPFWKKNESLLTV